MDNPNCDVTKTQEKAIFKRLIMDNHTHNRCYNRGLIMHVPLECLKSSNRLFNARFDFELLLLMVYNLNAHNDFNLN